MYHFLISRNQASIIFPSFYHNAINQTMYADVFLDITESEMSAQISARLHLKQPSMSGITLQSQARIPAPTPEDIISLVIDFNIIVET